MVLHLYSFIEDFSEEYKDLLNMLSFNFLWNFMKQITLHILSGKLK